MNIGLGTYSFPWLVHSRQQEPLQLALQLLDYTASKGLHRFQFGDNLPLHLVDDAGLDDILRRADAHGIDLQVGMRRLDKPELKRYLDIAIRLRSPFLRVVIDDSDYHPDLRTSGHIIREVAQAFRQSGVVLAIENHDRFPATHLLQLLQQSDGAAGICLDTANSLGCGEGVGELLHHLAPHVVNLHVKDITIQRVESKMGFKVEGTVAGRGVLNIPFIIGILEDFGRCDTATLELWSSSLPDSSATLDREQRQVEESIRYLTGITFKSN